MRTAPAAPGHSTAPGRHLGLVLLAVAVAVLLQVLVAVGAVAAVTGELPWQHPDPPCSCSITQVPGAVS